MYVAKCSSDRVAFFKNPDVTWPEIDSLIQECISLEPGGSTAFTSKGLGNGQAYGLSKACLNLYTMLVARENPSLTGEIAFAIKSVFSQRDTIQEAIEMAMTPI